MTRCLQILPIFVGRTGAALAVICLSQFMICVDATIVSVALPTLSQSLAATTTDLQWFTDAYILVLAGPVLAMGSLSDRFGRRGWLCLGLAAFGATSVVASQADTASQLIVARAAMGAGAAVVVPTTLSLITNIFSDPRGRARAIALWAAMTGLGIAVGPVTGGWLLEHFCWGSIFLVNVFIAAIAIIGAVLFVPTSRDPAVPPIDFGGLVLSAVGLIALVYTIIEAPNVGWTSDRTVAGFALAAITLFLFVWWEKGKDHPMLDISMLRNRRFAGGSLAVTAAQLTVFGFIFLATQYLQFCKNYSPFGTGLAVLPVAGALAAAATIAPRLVERIGTTPIVVVGLLSLATGMAWGSLLSAATTYAEISIVMILVGAGLGLTSAPATEAIMGSLRPEKAGIGSAANESARQAGAALGVAIVGSVFTSTYSGRLSNQPPLTRLPESARAAMRDSVATAHSVIDQLPVATAHDLRFAVSNAFFEAFSAGSLLCACIAMTLAAVVAVVLPNRDRGNGELPTNHRDVNRVNGTRR